MNEENTYDNIPTRYKEYVGFPTNYSQLSLEQKFFVDSIFCAKLGIESDTTIYEIECIKDDLESALEVINKIMLELRGKRK